MIDLISEYWAFSLVIIIIIASNALNLTLFKDVSVRPEKDHIESGWGGALDETANDKQKNRREISTRLMWFFTSIVLVLSIFF